MGLLKDIILPYAVGTKHRVEDKSTVRSTRSDSEDSPITQAQKRSTTQSFKRGGRVKRTGLARVHKGERVLTRKQARAYSRGKRSAKR